MPRNRVLVGVLVAVGLLLVVCAGSAVLLWTVGERVAETSVAARATADRAREYLESVRSAARGGGLADALARAPEVLAGPPGSGYVVWHRPPGGVEWEPIFERGMREPDRAWAQGEVAGHRLAADTWVVTTGSALDSARGLTGAGIAAEDGTHEVLVTWSVGE